MKFSFALLAIVVLGTTCGTPEEDLHHSALADVRLAIRALPAVDREEISEHMADTSTTTHHAGPSNAAQLLKAADTSGGRALTALRATETALLAMPAGVRAEVASHIARARHSKLECPRG